MSGGDSPRHVKIEIKPVKVEIDGGEEVSGARWSRLLVSSRCQSRGAGRASGRRSSGSPSNLSWTLR